MRLSIIIPVYNEQETLPIVLGRLEKIAFPCAVEIIVVDDGSTDGTAEQIDELREETTTDLKAVRHPRNLGKGAAVRTALRYCGGDYVVIQDADLELDPEDILKMLTPALQGGADVVYGSRFMKREGTFPRPPWLNLFANKFLTGYTNLLFAGGLTDMSTGFKLVRAELMRCVRLRCSRFDFEPEITAILLRLGHKIIEVPVGYNPRSRRQGKKIGWRDGIRYLLVLTKYRVSKKSAFIRSSDLS